MLLPRQIAPDLAVETLKGARFNLVAENPSRMTLVCFYRGLHCPVCSNYLKELDRLTPAFADRGVTTIAISSDTEERAHRMSQKISSVHLRIGFGLKLADARKWGLYISASRGESTIGIEEPALFSEPGVFFGEARSFDLLPRGAVDPLRSAQFPGDDPGAGFRHQQRLSGQR